VWCQVEWWRKGGQWCWQSCNTTEAVVSTNATCFTCHVPLSHVCKSTVWVVRVWVGGWVGVVFCSYTYMLLSLTALPAMWLLLSALQGGAPRAAGHPAGPLPPPESAPGQRRGFDRAVDAV
jgi:hypothetical protein